MPSYDPVIFFAAVSIRAAVAITIIVFIFKHKQVSFSKKFSASHLGTIIQNTSYPFGNPAFHFLILFTGSFGISNSSKHVDRTCLLMLQIATPTKNSPVNN